MPWAQHVEAFQKQLETGNSLSPTLASLPSACSGISYSSSNLVGLTFTHQFSQPTLFSFQRTGYRVYKTLRSSPTGSYDRSLLSELSRCVWESLRLFCRRQFRKGVRFRGAVIAIQMFGDFLGFQPHCHVLCTRAVFMAKGFFRWCFALILRI